MRYRVGIVGAGVGREHATAFAALPAQYEIAAICDLDLKRAERLAEEFRVPWITDDIDSFVQHDLDIVDVCTWPNTHYDMSVRALRAEKHVICEKPLAGSLTEVAELSALSREVDRVLMPIFQFRYGRGLQRLKHLVRNGVAGQAVLATIETSWLRDQDYYDNPRRGRRASELGGVCMSQAIHAHDALTYILGPVATVSANTATRLRDIEVENTLAATLRMQNGALATLSACLASAWEVSRYRFVFENLTAESSNLPYNPASEPWVIKPRSDAAADAIANAMQTFVESPELYVGQFQAFHHSLTAGVAPPVTMDDAMASLQLVAALYHSADTGDRVALPISLSHSASAALAG